MASSPFERQVVEGDATDDRSPSAPQMADGPQQYEPSPSFLDHDRPAMRLVELPAWLQSFAASVGEPSEDEAPPELEELQSAEEPEATTGQPSTAPVARSSKPAAPKAASTRTDFISEDDLPEWLRSIAPEDPADSAMDTLIFDHGDEGDQITVPTITRAWSTSKDSRGVDEATSLFALVASQSPQTAIPDQGAGTATRSAVPAAAHQSGQVAGYGSNRPPAEAPSVEIPIPDFQVEEKAEGSGRSLPILPIAVAAILVLILVGAAAVMFVL